MWVLYGELKAFRSLALKKKKKPGLQTLGTWGGGGGKDGGGVKLKMEHLVRCSEIETEQKSYRFG